MRGVGVVCVGVWVCGCVGVWCVCGVYVVFACDSGGGACLWWVKTGKGNEQKRRIV